MTKTVPLADYLFIRLRQLNVESIHGVPGDFNLALLDYIKPLGLHWVGNCNELNAGYAADAYARVKGLGALITTFGVGELSAINAIAGAYSELAPVVHIVGTPARQLQDSRALVHHTLNDGDFRRFAQMHIPITVAQADLLDPRTCPQLIDATIQQCLVHSRPVYIELPQDMVAMPVCAERLDQPISLPPSVSHKDEEAALDFVLQRMYASERPMILIDGESRAYNILPELNDFVQKTAWPTWTTVFGKSCISESLPNVHGIWRGREWATQAETEYVESVDLVLCFGPHFSSTNSYFYSAIPDKAKTILFMPTSVKHGTGIYRDLPAKHFLHALLSRLEPSKLHPHISSLFPKQPRPTLAFPPPTESITQDRFYHLYNSVLRPGDIILAETGTAGQGVRDFILPPHTTLFKPSTWLSIGYMLPATLGAALAQRELHSAGKWADDGQHHDDHRRTPRTILLIGDGSFQMTAQELGTIIKEKLNVEIVLINNDGYTIERCLHGWDQDYNDIAPWKYLLAPECFGAKSKDEVQAGEYHAQTSQVRTWGELREMVEKGENEGKEVGSRLKMVEVFMDKEDAPATLAVRLKALKEEGKGSV